MTNGFPSKKAARTNAAKEAVQYLIEAGDLNPDGSTKARKKVKLGTAVRIKGKGLEVKQDTTYAQKVNGIPPFSQGLSHDQIIPNNYQTKPYQVGRLTTLQRHVSPPWPRTPPIPPPIRLGTRPQYAKRIRRLSQRTQHAGGNRQSEKRVWEEECEGGGRKGSVGGVGAAGREAECQY